MRNPESFWNAESGILNLSLARAGGSAYSVINKTQVPARVRRNIGLWGNPDYVDLGEHRIVRAITERIRFAPGGMP
jgi:hypothetical protein